jgi:hypothetical protein
MRIPALLFAATALAVAAHPAKVPLYGLFETELKARKTPFQPLTLDAKVTFTCGKASETVEAFWDGGDTYRVRYQPLRKGACAWSVASSDAGLNGQSGKFSVTDALKTNGLAQHGPPVVSKDRRSFTHTDGTPWLWLADTAWSGALKATKDDWDFYLAERAKQKFTAVQIVMTQYRATGIDERGQIAFRASNGVMEVDTGFFRRMDERIAAIRDHGLVPVPAMLWVLGSSAGESPGAALEIPQATALARYIRARYHAYGPLWLLGGDGNYTSAARADKWKRLGREVFPPALARRPVSLHPQGMQDPWPLLKDEPWIDFFAYQTGHGDSPAKWMWNATKGPASGAALSPPRPVIDAEPNYEGTLAYESKKKVEAPAVRRAAWYSLLSAPVAGVTYGAHGVWYWANKYELPFDHAYTGIAEPWRDCLSYEGARSMTVLHDVLARLPWWTLRPAPGLTAGVEVAEDFSNYVAASRAADGSVAILYVPAASMKLTLDLSSFAKPVSATWISPRDGSSQPPVPVKPAKGVSLQAPGSGDWLLLIQPMQK